MVRNFVHAPYLINNYLIIMNPDTIENFLDRNGLYDSFTPYEVKSDFERMEGWNAKNKGDLAAWLTSHEECAYSWVIWHIGKNEIRRTVTLEHMYGQREQYMKDALEGDMMSILLVMQATEAIAEIEQLKHIGS